MEEGVDTGIETDDNAVRAECRGSSLLVSIS